jgi:hypothetical protein
MRFLRTARTSRLLAAVAAALALAAAASAIAVAAGGSGPKPPAKPLDQAIRGALAAKAPAGISARVTFTNKLLPSGALTGNAGSALVSGGAGRLWITSARGRIELPSSPLNTEIVWSSNKVTVYDGSSNTVYRASLPTHSGPRNEAKGANHALPTLAEIDKLLGNARTHVAISAAVPKNVASQPAYEVTLSPKDNGSLLKSAQLAWDAVHGVPLRVAVYAKGSSSPVLALEATDISYGPVSAANVSVSPPPDAKVIDLRAPTSRTASKKDAKDTQSAALPFSTPDRLGGRARQFARAASGGVVAVYGRGLGALVLYVHKGDTAAHGNPLSGLPTVDIAAGVKAHELATPLATVLSWQRNATAYVLGGSVTPATAEAAAREIG